MTTPESGPPGRAAIEYDIIEAPHLSELKVKLEEAGSRGWAVAAHAIHDGPESTQFIVILQRVRLEGN